jgi:hypothetical protein
MFQLWNDWKSKGPKPQKVVTRERSNSTQSWPCHDSNWNLPKRLSFKEHYVSFPSLDSEIEATSN